MTDDTKDLLARQRALQAEADQVRTWLDLDRVLSSVGKPTLVGSAALGLMVWRDLDTTVTCTTLDKRRVLDAATQLAAHPDIRSMRYRDDTGRFNREPEKYPDGLYIGLQFQRTRMSEWKLDLWFVDDPDRQPDLAHVRTVSQRMTDEARLAILRIKSVWSTRPEYGKSVSSWDVYTAVLDQNVRDTQQFHAWLEQRRPDRPAGADSPT